ncbi:reverse transcriptase family protein [Streptococcus dysgalactiae]|uniref:reverse transcriptase family protein n=1 Tax=Streptococcus dysgalactiae TaxID=1334 RepID=UPI003D7B7463
MGLFQYTRLPFGICATPGIFQRLIDNLFRDVSNTCAYLDDLITDRTEKEHLETLNCVLQRLEERGLRLKKSKGKFLANAVEYLGFVLNKDGLHPIADRMKPILETPTP